MADDVPKFTGLGVKGQGLIHIAVNAQGVFVQRAQADHGSRIPQRVATTIKRRRQGEILKRSGAGFVKRGDFANCLNIAFVGSGTPQLDDGAEIPGGFRRGHLGLETFALAGRKSQDQNAAGNHCRQLVGTKHPHCLAEVPEAVNAAGILPPRRAVLIVAGSLGGAAMGG